MLTVVYLFRTYAVQVDLELDDMELAGDLVQSLATNLSVTNLNVTAIFKKDFASL